MSRLDDLERHLDDVADPEAAYAHLPVAQLRDLIAVAREADLVLELNPRSDLVGRQSLRKALARLEGEK